MWPVGSSTAPPSVATVRSLPGAPVATVGWATRTRPTCTSPSRSSTAAARRWRVARCTRRSWASPRCARASTPWAPSLSSSVAAASSRRCRTHGCTPRRRTSCAAGTCTTSPSAPCTRRCTPMTARSHGARVRRPGSWASVRRARSPRRTRPRSLASTASRWPRSRAASRPPSCWPSWGRRSKLCRSTGRRACRRIRSRTSRTTTSRRPRRARRARARRPRRPSERAGAGALRKRTSGPC
mmetsp:Transcript_29354/g.74433  ORF Transcript_29354/g.74433 Transcript_29354/m.74433 type:complete len:240 (-) Transcript_29354:232-951(-)